MEICTPNHMHAEMATAALTAGKPVNVEKPLAMHYEEACAILAAQKKSGAIGMTCFSYRFQPAVRYAKRYVKSRDLFVRRWGYVMWISKLCRDAQHVDDILALMKNDDEYYVPF